MGGCSGKSKYSVSQYSKNIKWQYRRASCKAERKGVAGDTDRKNPPLSWGRMFLVKKKRSSESLNRLKKKSRQLKRSPGVCLFFPSINITKPIMQQRDQQEELETFPRTRKHFRNISAYTTEADTASWVPILQNLWKCHRNYFESVTMITSKVIKKSFIVQSISVEIYENRDKSRKSTKFGIHVLEAI